MGDRGPFLGRPPVGSSAPSGSAPPGPAVGGRAAAAPSVCPSLRSRGNCWCVRPPGCPDGPSAGKRSRQHLGVLRVPPPTPPRYQFASSKQSHAGGIGVQADLVLARRVRCEGEAALGAVLPRQHHLRGGGERREGRGTRSVDPPPNPATDPIAAPYTHFAIGVLHFHVHPQPRRGGQEGLGLFVPQLCPVVPCGAAWSERYT